MIDKYIDSQILMISHSDWLFHTNLEQLVNLMFNHDLYFIMWILCGYKYELGLKERRIRDDSTNSTILNSIEKED